MKWEKIILHVGSGAFVFIKNRSPKWFYKRSEAYKYYEKVSIK